MASPAQVEVFMELTMCIGLKTRTALTVGEAIAKELEKESTRFLCTYGQLLGMKLLIDMMPLLAGKGGEVAVLLGIWRRKRCPRTTPFTTMWKAA